jgi:hypothetical protein
VQSVLQFDALLLLYQGYLAMDLRMGRRWPLAPLTADCRTEQVTTRPFFTLYVKQRLLICVFQFTRAEMVRRYYFR